MVCNAILPKKSVYAVGKTANFPIIVLAIVA